ncbi:MAG: DUF1559 domain-containing protein [Planctomycetes bacterium]|nr:DUF1559 domain-containing protein [Planctomycetota bacterium]
MRSRSSQRSGFTLIEVLVVGAIVAVVLGLIVVAVVKVRGAMANAQCSHNLKEIGIACHATHQQHKRMPPAFGFYPTNNVYDGSTGLGNLFFHLLPYLQHHGLYQQARFKSATTPQQNFLIYTTRNVHQVQVPVYNCPSDGTLMPGIDPVKQYAPSSYAANYLVFGNVDKNFISKDAQGQPKLGASFPDGMSQTVLLGEKYASAWISAANNQGWSYEGGCHWAYFHADCHHPFFAYYEPAPASSYAWMDPKAIGPDSRFQVQPKAAGGCNPCLAATAHNAMNVCMADGSVRSLAASIDPAVWWALVTPASNDKPGDGW